MADRDFQWFNSDGSLRLKVDHYFNADDGLEEDVVDFLEIHLHKFPSDSQAVRMYYSDKYMSCSGDTTAFDNYIHTE